MKITDDLMQALTFPDVSLDNFLSKNADKFITSSPVAEWNMLFKNSSLKNVDIINRCQFNPVYFYEVINGKKIPSRDKVIRLLLGFEASLTDCQRILRIYEYSPLYPRIFRDSLLIHSICRTLSVDKVQQLLISHGEEPLS